MTGGRYLRAVPDVHDCYPPSVSGTNDDYVFDFNDPDFVPPRLREGVRLPAVGDVWECPCGRTWRLCPPPPPGRYVHYLLPEWRPEAALVRWWRRLRERLGR